MSENSILNVSCFWNCLYLLAVMQLYPENYSGFDIMVGSFSTVK